MESPQSQDPAAWSRMTAVLIWRPTFCTACPPITPLGSIPITPADTPPPIWIISWPWTRLGYTFDYENSANSPVGLSEYVVHNCSDTNYWGADLVIPIYVDAVYPDASYSQ